MVASETLTGIRKVLIVEDHLETSDAEMDFLKIFFPDWEVSRCSAGREALRRVQDEPPHLIILDIALNDEFDGLDVIRQIARLDIRPQVRIVLVTAMGNRAFRGPRVGRPWLDQLHDHERAIVHGFFEKPLRWKTFLQELARIVEVPVPAHLQEFPAD